MDKRYVIQREREVAGPNVPNLFVQDVAGTNPVSATIWFPNSRRVVLLDASVTESGSILASGYSVHEDGRIAHFIARTDQAGKVEQVIRTTPFVADNVCSTNDGGVWAFGHDRDVENKVTQHDYTILRKFTFENGEDVSFLKKSDFPGRFAVWMNGGTSKPFYMRCTRDKVAVYSGMAGEYIELRLPTMKVHRWRLPDLGNAQMTGFAVTKSGIAHASFNSAASKEGMLGIFRLHTDDATGLASWVPIPGSIKKYGEPDAINVLLGTEGDDLVFLYAGDYSTLHWGSLR
ncbi:MAG TPA: hypothetical protein VD837_01845 [Terriglobales bacterium]|nr:hypothetical protein [Terriglobales bacterium]